MRGGGPEGILGRPKAPDCPPKNDFFGTPGCSLPVLGTILARFGNPAGSCSREKKPGLTPWMPIPAVRAASETPTPPRILFFFPPFPISLPRPHFPPGIESKTNPRLPNPGRESSGGAFPAFPRVGNAASGASRGRNFGGSIRRRFPRPFPIHRIPSGAAFLPAGRLGTPRDAPAGPGSAPGSREVAFPGVFSRPAGALAGPCPAPPPLIRALIPAAAAGSGVTGSPRHTASIPGSPSSPVPGFLSAPPPPRAHGELVPLKPRCSAPRGLRGGRSSFLPLPADSSGRRRR